MIIHTEYNFTMTKKFIIITSVLSILWIMMESGIGWLRGLIGSIVDIVLIAFFVTLIRLFITRSVRWFSYHFLRNSLFCWSIIGGISAILLSFAFISNSFPGSISAIEMSDGKRHIVFMQMSHIGTEEYYAKVNLTLRELSASGYNIYREWVLPWTKENTDRFDRTLGMKISSGTYADFASLIGLIAQDDRIFSDIPRESIRSVDLTLDQIVTLMGTWEIRAIDPPRDPSIDIQTLRDGRSWPLLGYILRWVLNFSLSHISEADILLDAMDPTLREALLTHRNAHVVETFFADSWSDIVIVYGALHFEWIYKLLQSKNPSWKITAIEPYYPYKK